MFLYGETNKRAKKLIDQMKKRSIDSAIMFLNP